MHHPTPWCLYLVNLMASQYFYGTALCCLTVTILSSSFLIQSSNSNNTGLVSFSIKIIILKWLKSRLVSMFNLLDRAVLACWCMSMVERTGKTVAFPLTKWRLQLAPENHKRSEHSPAMFWWMLISTVQSTRWTGEYKQILRLQKLLKRVVLQ